MAGSQEGYILALAAALAVARIAITWAQEYVTPMLSNRAVVSLVLAVYACAIAAVVGLTLQSLSAERCVDVKTMTVAARQDCRNLPQGPAGRPGGTSNEDRFAWYYGGSGTDKEGGPAKGGSFTAPGAGSGGTSGGEDGGEGGGGE